MMKRWLGRALKLGPEDLERGLLLSACLFLIISSYVIGKVARDALFLARFRAVQLPYADIASGVLVGFVVYVYLRIGRRVLLRDLLVGSQIFFAVNCTAFWVLAHFYHPDWLFPVFYVWVGIFGVLAPTQVWTLANYLLTTREAKRIFGMVGGGAILGWIFAGFISKSAARAFGTESLLLGMVPFLVLSAVLMYVVWPKNKFGPEESNQSSAALAGTGTKDIQGSIRVVLSSPYLKAIAAVVWISSFVTTLTGWQFKAIAKNAFSKSDSLAIFFGDFYFYAGILAFAFQSLLTTRFLRRFGIKTMLFTLPVCVLVGSTGLLIWGTLAAAVLLKGSDQVLRYSIDRSTVELLYLPLSHRVKLQAKWFIDTVIWRLGDGLAGVVVLVFAAYLHLAPRQLSWIALVLIAGWLTAVLIGGREYLVALKDSITGHRLDAEQATALALDRSTSSLLASKLQASDPNEILYALSLFEVERTRMAHPVIRTLLDHPAPEVRQKALSILSASSDTSVLPEVERLLKDPTPSVRTEAMLYLVHHAHVDPLVILDELSDFDDFCVRSAVAAYLARPGSSQDLETAGRLFEALVAEGEKDNQRARKEVARLLGELPDAFGPLLFRLLCDDCPDVIREAIRSAGMLRRTSLAPQLVQTLNNQELSSEAAQALARFGDSIIGYLNERFEDRSTPAEIRREIPFVLASIGSDAAARALLENVLERDSALRFKVIRALNKLRQLHPEIELDSQMLESILAAEILGHYRSYQILGAIGFPKGSKEPVVAGLTECLEQELERIFRLLNLLFPRLDFHSVYLGLQSQNKSVHDNALEFLETALKSQLRTVLVPLLDGRVSLEERVDLANRLVRTTVENREQAVAALVSSEDPWLKSCGAYAIGSFGMMSLARELDRCLEHPDPLLRETARAAKLRLASLA
jgi:ATP:ADP antiporter, AAA family